MSWMRFFHRGRWDDERARELKSYLDHEIDDNLARGMRRDDAIDAARRKLGNATIVREEIYAMNTLSIVDSLWQDVRYGVRVLRSNPGFAVVAILSLALGVGANTAIFELLNAVRLRTLPVDRPQEIVEVRIGDTGGSRTGHFVGRHPRLTYALWEEIRAKQRAFSGVFAWGNTTFELAAGGESRPAEGLWVSGDFFKVLGVRPLMGRLLDQADDRRGCAAPSAVLSYAFWQSEYGGDRSILGRRLLLDGHPFDIAGVTPPSFFGVEVGRSFDVAVPICADAILRSDVGSAISHRNFWWLAVMGRLRPGWSSVQATAQLEAVSPGIFQETVAPEWTAADAKHFLQFRLAAFPAAIGVSRLRDAYETPLWLLLATAGLVLLIACGNIANLMIARASAREREIAVRLAIGASRTRVARQLLAESLLLAGAGAALGVWIAQILSRALVAYISTTGSAVFFDLRTDWRVLAFTTVLAVTACLLFGLTPALRATRTPPGAAIKSSGRSSTDSRERFGLRRALVVVQVALSVVLVVGALLFGRTLGNLLTLDPGLRETGVLVVSLDLRRANIAESRQDAFKRDLLERYRRLPDVQSAAAGFIVPLAADGGWNERIVIGGLVQKMAANFNRVSDGFFRLFGTPVLAGRDFDARDTLESVPVAIVNESFAKEYFHTGNPIGQTFKIEGPPSDPSPLYQVIGLVKDTKYTDLRDPFGPICFLATSQDKHPGPYETVFVTTSSAPLSALTSSIKRTTTEASPDALLTFQTLESQVQDSLLRERLMATLAGFFGGLAALLATIGLYGVMSYMVARRRHEIGIRMALGADAGAVLRMILTEAGRLLAVGLVAGAILSVAAARAARALLFGLGPGDPMTLIMAVTLMAGVALLAAYVPALRAARLEPTGALREE